MGVKSDSVPICCYNGGTTSCNADFDEGDEGCMRLTPREMDRLTIFSAAELARRRRARGLKLNHPEAIALICDEVLEYARDGNSYQETLEHATRILSREDVMEGVPELVDPIRLEVRFPEGTKLVFVRTPIQ